MDETRYTFRAGPLSRECTYSFDSEALSWKRSRAGRLRFDDIRVVHLDRQFMRREEAAIVNKKMMWRMRVYGPTGRAISLAPLHYKGFRRWEDRSDIYIPFAQGFLAKVRQANPAVQVIAEPHWSMRLRRRLKTVLSPIYGALWLGLDRAIRRLDPERTIRTAGRILRFAGPLSRAHRTAIANLKAALPDKSEREIALLLDGMWDNFGRQMAEYAFLDRFSKEFRDRNSQRVLVDAQARALLAQLCDSDRPVLLFTAHLANWELLPAMAFAHGLRAGWLFRPPPSDRIERSVVEKREKVMGSLIPARPGAAARLAQLLRSGSSVGMLADQHFIGGVDVVFFGRACKVNPTLARLARAFECPIHGARSIRLPDGRFQLELTNALDLPRDEAGKVDIPATMQMITWTIETWVREHPEQWFWMHRRWRP